MKVPVSNKVLIISGVNELVRIKPERVVYVESDGNYSTMVLHDKAEQVFTMNLAHCQQLSVWKVNVVPYFIETTKKWKIYKDS